MSTATAKSAKVAKPTKADKKELASAALEAKAPWGTAKKAQLLSIPLKDIRVERGHNPRMRADPAADDAMLKSVRKHGIITPITVRPDGKNGWLVVAGERRFRAAQEAKLTEIPASIRTDWAEEKAAKSAALVENNEDVRLNLSFIELGTTFAKLVELGLDEKSVASETGYHVAKVRRCLELVALKDVPGGKEILAKVQAGELTATAALELAKLDPDTRKAIKDELKEGTSAADVKKLAKAAAKAAEDKASEEEEEEPELPDGKGAKGKKGAARDKAIATWRGSREKVGELRQTCAKFLEMEADAEDKGCCDQFELRGSIAWALWDRGELSVPVAPDLKPKDAAGKTALEVFNRIIKVEAERYTPPAEEGDGEDVEDDDEDGDEA